MVHPSRTSKRYVLQTFLACNVVSHRTSTVKGDKLLPELNEDNIPGSPHSDEDEAHAKGPEDDERQGVAYNYTFFHVTFMLGVMYVFMLMTDWQTVSGGQSNDEYASIPSPSPSISTCSRLRGLGVHAQPQGQQQLQGRSRIHGGVGQVGYIVADRASLRMDPHRPHRPPRPRLELNHIREVRPLVSLLSSLSIPPTSHISFLPHARGGVVQM